MPTRIGIYSHTPSNSVGVLSAAMSEAGHNSRVLRSGVNSLFRGRNDDYVINYGSSSTDNVGLVTGMGRVINPPDAVRDAANKARSFDHFNMAGISTVQSTTSRQTARRWAEEGNIVYCRETTNGHSGDGIAICSMAVPEDLGNFNHMIPSHLISCPLYTKGISGRRREIRVHVAFGQVILAQQKRRRDGYQEMENYSNVVRNYESGWIYATSTVSMSDATKDLAVAAVKALNLDFGAVDIITHEESAWVLEVNTAPGLQGESSRAAYTDAFSTFLNNPTSYVLSANVEPVSAPEEVPVISTLSPEDLVWNFEPPTGTIDELIGEEEGASVSEEPITRSLNIPRPIVSAGLDRLIREMEDNASEERSLEFPTDDWYVAPTPTEDPLSEQHPLLRTSGRAPTTVPPTLDPFPGAEGQPIQEEAPREHSPNPMDSTGPEASSDAPFEGEGHYVVEMRPGVRTVVYVAPDGTIYTAEHDLVLQESAVSVISKIAV